MYKVFLTLTFLFSIFYGIAQNVKDTLSISFKDLSLEVVLDSISQKTGYSFSYNSDILPKGSLFVFSARNWHIDKLLDALLVGTGIYYTKLYDYIILKKKDEQPEFNELYVNGIVKDSETGEAIVGASVFLNGTSWGAYTDENGIFKIGNLARGKYELVFSHATYYLKIFELLIGDRGVTSMFYLEPKTLRLDDIEIVASALEERQRIYDYKEFVEIFLGKSKNARRSKIINLDQIRIFADETTDSLFAISDEPIQVINKGLGYHIYFDLVTFIQKGPSTYFVGKARFEALTPKNNRQLRRWRKKREIAYGGSFHHFLRALINGNTHEEGFRMYLFDDSLGADPVPVGEKDLLKRSDDAHWMMRFSGSLLVEYLHERPSDLYLQERPSRFLTGRTPNLYNENFQRSVISLRNDSVRVNPLGLIVQTITQDQLQKRDTWEDLVPLSVLGYWSWERVGEQMPADYDLPAGDRGR